jgi:hypothetical protein
MAAAGQVFPQRPGLDLFERRGRIRMRAVNPPHGLGHLSRFHGLDKQLPFILQPVQQLLFLEERMEVNEALDVQAHVVVTVDKAESNEGWAAGEG